MNLSMIQLIQNKINELKDDISRNESYIKQAENIISHAQSSIEHLQELIYDFRNHIDVTRYKVIYESGRKIEAIKAYRNDTGYGIKEAKDAIEQAASLNGWIYPDNNDPTFRDFVQSAKGGF